MRAVRMIMLGFLLSLTAVVTAMAQDRDCNDFANYIHPIATVKYFDTEHARAVDLVGNIAYVVSGQSDMGTYDSEFYILDIEDPAAPLVIGGIEDLPSLCNDVDLRGDYAFVCAGSYAFNGILAIDITDPVNPTVVDTCVTVGYARNLVFAAGDTAYVACGIDGFKVVDYTDPLNPGIIGSLAMAGSAVCVTVDGDYAYVGTTGATAMVVINIADPTDPTFEAAVDTPDNYTYGICKTGDYIYTADYSSGVFIFDVSAPTDPMQIQSYPLDYCYSVLAAGNTLYVGGNGLFVLDITSPFEPGMISAINTAADHFGMGLSGNILVAPAWESGTMLVDVTNPVSAQLAASVPTVRTAWHVDVLDGYAYVAATNFMSSFIEVFDLTNPAVPGSVHQLEVFGFSGRPVAVGSYLYSPFNGGFQVVDITDPTIPDIAANVVIGNGVEVMVYRDGYLYSAASDSGLVIHDLVDPALPAKVGQAHTPDPAYDLALSGDYAYVVCGSSGLQVVNITTPGAPEIVGSHTDSNFYHSVAAFGDHVYLSDHSSITVIDCSTPASPTYLEEISQPGNISNMQVKGKYLYVGTSNLFGSGSGVWLYDLTDPADPAPAGYLPTSHYANDFDTDGDYIYIAGGNAGLHTALRQCDTTPVLIGDFNVSAGLGVVTVGWELASASNPGSFRLTAAHRNLSWDPEFVETAPGVFSARDTHPLLAGGGEFTYTLFAREEGAGWLPMRRESLWLEPVAGTVTAPATGLDGAWPNPFNPVTTISFNLETGAEVRLSVFDSSGRMIRSLHQGSLNAGHHQRTWDSRDLHGRQVGSGIYFAELVTGGRSSSIRLVLLK